MTDYNTFLYEIERRCRTLKCDCDLPSAEAEKMSKLMWDIYYNRNTTNWWFSVGLSSSFSDRVELINTIWNSYVMERFKKKNIL